MRTIQVAQQLIKNLMWLERSNPLLTITELMAYGCRISERVSKQLDQIRDFWDSELSKMKNLEMMMRYLINSEIDTISTTMRAPEALPSGRNAPTRLRRVTTLGRGYDSDLSLAMPRGRAEDLGGGSIRICTTA